MRGRLIVVLTVLAMVGGAKADSGPPAADWAAVTRTMRPWTYWWWMGSAVDTNNIARQLEQYHAAGLGGVHIIPIYGARGWESHYIRYLSPQWMAMLAFTVREADGLDMGVDMTTGTGWCFGGPTITAEEANAVPVVRVTNGVYTVTQRPTAKVKRAAPGDEGWMLNPFYPEAMTNYLRWFDAAFAQAPRPWPRAQYQDSYEYESAWAPDLLAQFARRRGYRLQDEWAALFGHETNDEAGRVKCDYRETLSDIMVEQTIPAWVAWSHAHGFITRYQAHGAPGNLLDLYACADVPETEMFHLDRSRLVSKFASSAGDVAGRKLVSSETGTWLGEHFTGTLGEMKGLVDDMFLSGINHVFYHGCCYSPATAPWPGWVFYASFEMNPRNLIWRDVPALNAYVARCQSFLQAGRPDNDILLYWPIYDLWSAPQGLEQELTVDGKKWFQGRPIGKTAQWLWERGYQFDYVSDRRLAKAKAVKQAIIVPRCERMPVETFSNLLRLARGGTTVIFTDGLPDDVPGWGDLARRREQLRTLRAAAGGVFRVGMLEVELAKSGAQRETMLDQPGLMCVRRTDEKGEVYFVANRGAAPFDGWIAVAKPGVMTLIMDPMSGARGEAATKEGRVRLQLAAGESRLLRTLASHEDGLAPWKYWTNAGDAVELKGNWQVTFVVGGPELPRPVMTNRLSSWSQWPEPETDRFAGTARYTLHFDAPNAGASGGSGATHWRLDLGKVCQSARVRLNGREVATLIGPAFSTVLDGVKPVDNELEIEVTSVAANRIRDLDRRKVKWKYFRNINFVNIDYKPFDASDWPLADCGLLGPVTLRPVASLER